MIRFLLLVSVLRVSSAFAPLLSTRSNAVKEQIVPSCGDVGNCVFVPKRSVRLAAASSSADDADSSSGEHAILGGVSKFERWFADVAKEQKAKHAAFQSGTLRGLEYSGKDKRNILVVPDKLVLKTDYNRNKERTVDENWDSNLSVLLLKECLQGEESELSGYCSLLCRGVDFNSVACPPSTAPNALRHWTANQKARLRRSEVGEKLVKTAKRQMNRWSKKYEDLPDEDRALITEEQFLWAMEAVNSRAFKGNYGGGNLNKLQSLTLPFLAAIAGLIFLLAADDDMADMIAQFFGLLIIAPAALSLAEENKGPDAAQADAVLLPFIDSANHLEKAESTIEFNPVTGEFTLEIGRNCQVKEEDGQTQLYISYGPKTDRELLLNYGFLPGADKVKAESSDDDEDAMRDAQRKRLAHVFVRQN